MNQKGLMQPVYGLGWTLNFEIFFYALFAAALLLPLYLGLGLVTAALGSLVLLSFAVKLPLVLAFWARPIVLLFVAGMWLGVGWKSLPKRETPKSMHVGHTIPVALGDAAYSIYLTHSFLVGPLAGVMARHHFPVAAVVGIALIACSIFGVLTYRLVEKPLMKAINNWIPKSAVAQTVRPAS
jgi:exopolysaccharide production protein ExoZ